MGIDSQDGGPEPSRRGTSGVAGRSSTPGIPGCA